MLDIAHIDFETFSESDITEDGAAVYSEHPSTEVLCMAYYIPYLEGVRLWEPSKPAPQELFDFIQSGGLIAAHNSGFEFMIWHNVCTPRMGWPVLPFYQMRCSMSRGRAWGLPGKLKEVAKILGTSEQKDTEGQRLIKKFSKPRKPTAKDPRTRIHMLPEDPDTQLMYEYCKQDVLTEMSISEKLPELSPIELELWLLDQYINLCGVHIDTKALGDLQSLVNSAFSRYTQELCQITGNAVQTGSEVEKMGDWLRAQGVDSDSMDAKSVEALLKHENLPPDRRRVLELRQILSQSSVRKLDTIERMLSHDKRLRNLFMFCGAARTGRFAGRGPQPQNLPSSGPYLQLCPKCGKYSGVYGFCPHCMSEEVTSSEWTSDAVEDILTVAASRNIDIFESVFPDLLGTVSGSMRGLFCAAPGKDLLCSDYSAIEAVVLAFLSGESWREEVFRTHGKIYEMSASKISGVPFEELMDYKKRTGEHHPLRKKVGKVAELASGYGGGIAAWKVFGADKFMNDEEIKQKVVDWRAASPNVAGMWKALERAAVRCLKTCQPQSYRDTTFTFDAITGVMYARLLSGRKLAYHGARLVPVVKPWGTAECITYMSMQIKGGWQRIDTWGGKLTENIVQATARDLLTHAMVNVEKAGYHVILHVHDEIVTEVPEGTGSIEDLERIMGTMPEWAKDWPIKARGGWRGKRYRK